MMLLTYEMPWSLMPLSCYYQQRSRARRAQDRVYLLRYLALCQARGEDATVAQVYAHLTVMRAVELLEIGGGPMPPTYRHAFTATATITIPASVHGLGVHTFLVSVRDPTRRWPTGEDALVFAERTTVDPETGDVEVVLLAPMTGYVELAVPPEAEAAPEEAG